jgi:hypothetical protein
VVLSIEERVFFREGYRYTYLVQEQFAEKSAVYLDRPHTLDEVKTNCVRKKHLTSRSAERGCE